MGKNHFPETAVSRCNIDKQKMHSEPKDPLCIIIYVITL